MGNISNDWVQKKKQKNNHFRKSSNYRELLIRALNKYPSTTRGAQESYKVTYLN